MSDNDKNVRFPTGVCWVKFCLFARPNHPQATGARISQQDFAMVVDDLPGPILSWLQKELLTRPLCFVATCYFGVSFKIGGIWMHLVAHKSRGCFKEVDHPSLAKSIYIIYLELS